MAYGEPFYKQTVAQKVNLSIIDDDEEKEKKVSHTQRFKP